MDAAVAGARRAVVLGAVRSGIAAAEALTRCAPHVHVLLADRRPDAGEAPAGVEAVPGRDDPGLLAGADLLVKSPGVPEEAEIVRAARSAGIPVWAEVELAYRLLEERNPIVGITGTNGKTTTTLLTAAMLERGGIRSAAAGNLGTALSTFAGTIEPGRTIVCELSSFQLEGVESFRADAAVLLNLTPDHLDRHGTLAAYATAKLRVFERQREGDVAVLCDDDAYVAALAEADLPGDGRRVRVSGVDLGRLEEAFAASRLRGPHNRANTACAIAVARALGADEAGMAAALRDFAAPAHRLEDVRELRGVRYVDDSKATNVEATLQALASFDAPLHVILGGSLKGADFAPLAAPLARGASAVYLIGQAAPELRRAFSGRGIEIVDSGTLERALELAATVALDGDVVLLSPACASYDQFSDYEARGERFRALVEGLS
ncbi:MAG: UDP-N-acetylmuramoylalanine--D-glutamate ligase [Gaiellales bacterium]|jgi:UDP-N-acetylmuramoylalanine--D-glutamate ligase|nr:UDP-N-acetylmuramoylalanine--D-glutamate ligase [Gaiellales bacterium]